MLPSGGRAEAAVAAAVRTGARLEEEKESASKKEPDSASARNLR
jgi:hypothetical protein